MPKPIFNKTESIKVSLNAAEIEQLEEFAMRKGLLPEDAASGLIRAALQKMESESYSQIELKNTYGYKH